MSQISRFTLLSGSLGSAPAQGSWAGGFNTAKDPEVPSLPFESKPLSGFRSIALLGLGLGAALSMQSSVALKDQPDQASGAATLAVAAASSITDQPNTSSGAVTVAIAASGATVDLPDLTAGAVTLPVAASSALQDQKDSAAGAASLALAASSALADGPDRAASSASVGSAGFRSIAFLPLSVGAEAGMDADAALRDRPDTVSGAVVLPIGAAGALSDQPDRDSGAVTLASAASSALQDSADRAAGAVLLPIGASVSLADSGDTSAGAVTLSVAVSGALRDVGAILDASASGQAGAFRSLALLPLGIGALYVPPISATVALIDTKAGLLSSAGPGVLLTSINGTSDYRITAVPDLIVGDRIEVVSATGGPATDVTINPDGTFFIASGSTVTSFDVRIWSITDQEWGLPATQFVGLFVAGQLTEMPDGVQVSVGTPMAVSAALRDQADLAAGVVMGSVGFTSTLIDTRDTVSAAMAAMVGGSSSIADQSDLSASSAALALTLTGAAQDMPDLLAVLVGAQQSIATADLRDTADLAAAAAALPVLISGSVQDQVDRIAANVAGSVSATTGLIDVGDGVISLLLVGRTGNATLSDAQWISAGNAVIALVANFSGLDRADVLAGRVTLFVVETSGGYVAQMVLAERVYNLDRSDTAFTLLVDGHSFTLSTDERVFPLVKP